MGILDRVDLSALDGLVERWSCPTCGANGIGPSGGSWEKKHAAGCQDRMRVWPAGELEHARGGLMRGPRRSP